MTITTSAAEGAVRDLVLARLKADGKLDDPLAPLVLSVLSDAATLSELLESGVLPDHEFDDLSTLRNLNEHAARAERS